MPWQMDGDGIQQWVADGTSPQELGFVLVSGGVQEGSLGIDQQSYLWKGPDGGYYITPYDGTGLSVAPRKVPAVTDANIPGIVSGAATVAQQSDAANKAGFNRDVGLAATVMGGVGAANAGLFGPTSISGVGTPGAAGFDAAAMETLGVGLPTEVGISGIGISPSAAPSVAAGGATGGVGTAASVAGAAGGLSKLGSGLGTLGTIGTVAGLAGLAGGSGILSGKTESTVSRDVPGMSQEERELIELNKQLAQSQIDNINSLQPFQRQLIEASMAEIERLKSYNTAMDTALPPDMLAAAAKEEFDRTQRMGPIQEKLLQEQMRLLEQGTRATPEQIADIKAATDAGILSATGDIDVNTERGIGLIADELANARGLRLTDTPIAREATLLTRSAEDQKAGIIRAMRANEAGARLDYPLAVAGLKSNINQSQQQINASATQFQNDLRQRAYQNRLALTGQAQTGGIGLSSIGPNSGVLSGLTNSRLAGSSTTSSSSNPAAGIEGFGKLLSGAGGLIRGIGL